jgi:dephospho-CoA kinase
MLKIGLTGGIGSGKTTVTQLFAEFGVPIIDADVIAHQLSQPGQSALYLIEKTFGQEMLNVDGCLNRGKLRDLIFSESDKKKQLEAIFHPLVYAEITQQITQLKAAYCIISIPLLIETGKIDLLDRILVVDCPLEMQIERVKSRNQLTETQVSAIIATQATREQRLAIADDVIDNSKSSSSLAEQVKKLHNLYSLLSSS